jgi:hypothetical protein
MQWVALIPAGAAAALLAMATSAIKGCHRSSNNLGELKLGPANTFQAWCSLLLRTSGSRLAASKCTTTRWQNANNTTPSYY